MRALALKPIDKLDAVTFDEFIGRYDPFGSSECRLDLSDVQLVTPAGMVQLVAACHALKQGGRRPTVVVPQNSVRSYLCRAGCINVLRGVARLEPVSIDLVLAALRNERGGSPMLLEVTKLDSGATLPVLLDKIVHVLRSQLHFRKEDAFDAAVAISEVCQNTFEHGAGTSGFLAMQVYGQGPKRFVEVGLADYGDGLRTTLTRNPRHATIRDDGAAILCAVELGTSQFDDRTRGTGLYHLVEIARKHGGSVQIRSGAAKVRFRMDKAKGWMFAVPAVPGVQVALTLRDRYAA